MRHSTAVGFTAENVVRRSREWLRRLPIPLLFGAALGIAAVRLMAPPLWGDQTIYLYFADVILRGAKIGRDFVDSNPPLILWASMAPVMLGRALGILPQTAMKLILGASVMALLLWSTALFRGPKREASGREVRSALAAWLMLLVLLYATVIQPWYHLGQKDHVLAVLILPYLFSAGRVLDRAAPAPAWQRLLAGVLAGIACSLKPYHILVVGVVELMLMVRTSGGRPVIRAEAVGVAIGGFICVALVFVFAFDYVARIVPFLYQSYFEFMRMPLPDMIGPARLAKVAAALAIWWFLRRRSEYCGSADVFAAAGVAAFVAYILQEKGIEYQLVPARVFFHVAVGLSAVGLASRWLGRWMAPASGRSVPALVLASAVVVAAFSYPAQKQRAAAHWTDARQEAQRAVSANLAPGTTIFVLAPATGAIFDFLIRHELEWGSRFVHLWMIPAILHAEARSSTKHDELARWTRRAVTEDLAMRRPTVVLVDRCADPAFLPCIANHSQGYDVLPWFLRDADFQSVWAHYEKRQQFGPYDIWCAAEDDRICSPLLAALQKAAAPR